ncbi:Trifunctional UDP-glucose 4,6-dehydratase/UDP-4-keto-6-deoxy-D-glucose 3,5-epimerase/UDP-4-keto-L-rhamnose-reductase RHM1 [Hondaea fermentalgiana]|uniref:Trifunctional UDP-glucose 4,6-dehydratase/UDP-4-keto-6-deoxy-D-glucose 3,5-epimerase/UDP-4-keto-L-rhamnose-reductase RHM1 n=1 Tax=Hondaea fermentalgiana TaxID=2315210 RepID=A0A2R5GKU4_9STRA|nr:Trifunctional UDP-glucose 4,6-dehydratase/UDP-4-keto-6-deoxy-D-glucose 3,5-epimerase/UDP-4-keto-L-rhamnose-reductase RHM1 [Hondaea fermentalgiana]|eukprot:GBG29243.1 Trifunctional UDP-glucose 4,6-dehydratase/UDP-4-keto-6-deoxy-D-glucose 3,5-epimerase/UDP-4-keto-L-rhamnose-reductase RHM1 [Hondaea fermentalgiana]
MAAMRDAHSSLAEEDCRDLRFLVFGGKTGWLGQSLVKIIADQAPACKVIVAQSRMEDRAQVKKELAETKPTHVLCAAGVTGRPNVDWCEDHRKETVRANVLGTLTLCDVCDEVGIHLTIYATGCIYSYDAEHPLGGARGFTEEDAPNFHGSYYSKTKGMVEELVQPFLNNTLLLRVRMPLSEDMSAPRNFIYKIARYERVVDIPNSMTSLPDMLPVSVLMAVRGLTGVFNFTNPGVISHNQCLELYRRYVDPRFTWRNFTEAEQARVLKAPRSNNMLDTSKLEAMLPDVAIPDILTATENLFSLSSDRPHDGTSASATSIPMTHEQITEVKFKEICFACKYINTRSIRENPEFVILMKLYTRKAEAIGQPALFRAPRSISRCKT